MTLVHVLQLSLVLQLALLRLRWFPPVLVLLHLPWFRVLLCFPWFHLCLVSVQPELLLLCQLWFQLVWFHAHLLELVLLYCLWFQLEPGLLLLRQLQLELRLLDLWRFELVPSSVQAQVVCQASQCQQKLVAQPQHEPPWEPVHPLGSQQHQILSQMTLWCLACGLLQRRQLRQLL